MSKWMMAYSDAKAIEQATKDIAALEAAYKSLSKMDASPGVTMALAFYAKLITEKVALRNKLVAALEAQAAAYLDCLGGMIV